MNVKNFLKKNYIRKHLLRGILPYFISVLKKRKFFTVKYKGVTVKLSSLLWDGDVIYHHFHSRERAKHFFSSDQSERDSIDVSEGITLYIDVGGYNGVFGLLVAKKFPNAKVYVFEPNPLSAYVIFRNIELNNLKNITLNQAAVGNVNGLLPLRIEKNGSRVEFDLRQAFMVPGVSLDSFAEHFKEEDFKNVFIKIDAEGFDKQCLEGMQKFIKKCQSLKIILAIHAPDIIKLHGYTNQDLLNTAKSLGLRIIKETPSATNVTVYFEK